MFIILLFSFKYSTFKIFQCLLISQDFQLINNIFKTLMSSEKLDS